MSVLTIKLLFSADAVEYKSQWVLLFFEILEMESWYLLEQIPMFSTIKFLQNYIHFLQKYSISKYVFI